MSRPRVERYPDRSSFMRRCKKCLNWKLGTDFYSRTQSRDGIRSICINCWNKDSWGKFDVPGKMRCLKCRRWKYPRSYLNGSSSCDTCNGYDGKLERRLFDKFGITLTEYQDIWNRQDGKCAICFSEDSGSQKHPNLLVDHCHKTGKVRGLLCFRCNSALGLFDDKVEALLRAADYLRIGGSQ